MKRVPDETLTLITTAVIEQIVLQQHLSEADALDSFLHSQTYALLLDEENKLWHFAPLALWDMFYTETLTGSPLNSAYLAGEN
jgi:hypothetical protein